MLSDWDHEIPDWDHYSTPPSLETGHVFGTDALGRDLFVRTMIGGRISLLVGLVATLVSLLIGISYGAVAGYFRRPGRQHHDALSSMASTPCRSCFSSSC
jgi:oligopeptide transport system permease protein